LKISLLLAAAAHDRREKEREREREEEERRGRGIYAKIHNFIAPSEKFPRRHSIEDAQRRTRAPSEERERERKSARAWTEEAVLTFVVHAGFTDALFCKWLAIRRGPRTSQPALQPPASHPHRVISLACVRPACFLRFPGRSASVAGLLSLATRIATNAPRRKLILQFCSRWSALIYRRSRPFPTTANGRTRLNSNSRELAPSKGHPIIARRHRPQCSLINARETKRVRERALLECLR
jgi:hypothetical protein